MADRFTANKIQFLPLSDDMPKMQTNVVGSLDSTSSLSWSVEHTHTKNLCIHKNADTRDVALTKKVWERTQKTSHFKTASNSF